jgi:chemotaxis methyl-accepting protein methylase
MYRTLDVVVCWMDVVVYFSAGLQSKVQTSLQLCLVQI